MCVYVCDVCMIHYFNKSFIATVSDNLENSCGSRREILLKEQMPQVIAGAVLVGVKLHH